MIDLLATSVLAQRGDWLEGAIIVGVVVLSMIGSAGKWIVQQIAESKERNAERREGMPIRTPQRQTATIRDRSGDSSTPPSVETLPPSMRPPHVPTTQAPSPVMERMMEVLLERASGTPLEGRLREMMPKRPAPPPTPRAARAGRGSQPARPVAPPAAKRPMTIADREALRERVIKTEAEREAERLAQREQQLTDQTNQRIGHVETHITAVDTHESDSSEFREMLDALDEPAAARRALVLSEILAPPISLR